MPNPLRHTVIAAGDLLELLAPVVFIAIYAVIALLNRALSGREKEGPDVEVRKRPHRPIDKAPARPPARQQRLPYARGRARPQPARPSAQTRPQPVPRARAQSHSPRAGRSRPAGLPERFMEAYRRAAEQARAASSAAAGTKPQAPARGGTARRGRARTAKTPASAAPTPSIRPATATSVATPDGIQAPGSTAGLSQAGRSQAEAPAEALGSALLTALKRPATVRAAIVYAEVLGPCVAMRDGAGFTGPIGF